MSCSVRCVSSSCNIRLFCRVHMFFVATHARCGSSVLTSFAVRSAETRRSSTVVSTAFRASSRSRTSLTGASFPVRHREHHRQVRHFPCEHVRIMSLCFECRSFVIRTIFFICSIISFQIYKLPSLLTSL